MITTSIRRVTKAAFVNFWRNGWVSVATIMIMVMTLFVAGSLLLFQVLLGSTLVEVQKKVDVIVYFKTDAEESDVLKVESVLAGLPNVDSTEYISRQQALEMFEERNKNNALIASALDELGENPLGASIKIQANDPREYESIARFIDEGKNEGTFLGIDKVNFHQNELVFKRLSSVISSTRSIGLGVSIVLAIVAFLVTFNTIRLAIYTSRDEIGVMRLVGASNWFVRGPFLVEGVLHGIISAVLATLVFWPVLLWIGPKAHAFFGGVELFSYFSENLLQFFSFLLVVGIIVSVFSSFIATRRYLKV